MESHSYTKYGSTPRGWIYQWPGDRFKKWTTIVVNLAYKAIEAMLEDEQGINDALFRFYYRQYKTWRIIDQQ